MKVSQKHKKTLQNGIKQAKGASSKSLKVPRNFIMSYLQQVSRLFCFRKDFAGIASGIVISGCLLSTGRRKTSRNLVKFLWLNLLQDSNVIFLLAIVSPAFSCQSRDVSTASFDEENRLPMQLQSPIAYSPTERLAVKSNKTETVEIQYEE